MKKLFLLFIAMTGFAAGLFAQENNEKVRLDIVTGDSISTNLISTVNNTNLGIRLGLNNNKIGILAGGMIREGFCTADIEYGFPLDFYFCVNPYVGIELWNFELLGGLTISPDNEIFPYLSAAYNIDLIKPTEGFTDRLSLKLGVEYFMDMFKGEYGSTKDSLGAAAVDVLSLMIPKASIGIQYTFGWGF